MKALVIKIDEAKYLLSIDKIDRIIQQAEIVKIPDSQEYIDGVIDYDGEALKIISFRTLLGIEKNSNIKDQRVIILRHHDILFGLLVDNIDNIVEFDETEFSVVKSSVAINANLNVNKSIILNDEILMYVEFKDEFIV